VRYRSTSDPLTDLPSGEPATPGERWRAGLYIATAAGLLALVVLAVVFGRFAATGVLLVVFLSFVLAYLIGPAVERLRHSAAMSRRGRPLSRGIAVLAIYGLMAAVMFPLLTFGGSGLGTTIERIILLVPQHTARFIGQVRASERWHDTLGLPPVLDRAIGRMTRLVTRSVERETRAIGLELEGIRRLIPWLSTVPVAAFLLLTRWTRFRRSTTRVLPTPHLQWRGNEFLRNLNSVLAAYTRAQAVSALIVAAICWPAFAALRVSYPGTLAMSAGLLEMVPLAGPIVAAVVATAMTTGSAVPVLVFLAGLRLVQDYVIYPRLISRAMHLHPLAVIVALWFGAALGGVIGVCLAVPFVGVTQVTYRHWREYRDIEKLVHATARRDTA
jgi:predicted PurR-regulated permease PerM